MVLDTNLQLYAVSPQTVAVNNALSNAGAAVVIGNTGMHRYAQVVAIVGRAEVGRDMNFQIDLTTDGTNYETIGSLYFKAGYKGQRVLGLAGPEFAWERYTGSNIKLRATVVSANSANAGNWGRVRCYVGYGEDEHYGRLATADNIANL